MDGGSSWAVYQYYQYLSLVGARDGITRGDGSSRRRITIAAANFIRVLKVYIESKVYMESMVMAELIVQKASSHQMFHSLLGKVHGEVENIPLKV